MSWMIGRCTQLISAPGVGLALSGKQLNVPFEIVASSFDEMKAQRQQLAGLVDNEDESVVPFTWSDDSSLDGFYRVTGVTIGSTINMINTWFIPDCQLQLEQIARFSNAAVEVTTLSPLRVNAHGFTVPPAVVAVGLPNTMSETDLRPSLTAATAISRTDELGNVLTAYTLASPVTRTWYRTSAVPASHYAGACKIQVKYGSTWFDVMGQEPPLNRVWRISNGLVRLTSAQGATAGTFEVWDGTTWDSQPVAHWTNGAVGPGIGNGNGTSQTTLTIQRNSPEACVVKVGGAGVDFTYKVMRGNMHVEAAWTCTTATKYGAGNTVAAASTAVSTWGIRRTANDAGGNRLVFGMPVAITSDVVNGGINASTAATLGQMLIGIELAGSSAIAGNAAADIANQFFGAVSWRQQVVSK